MNQSIKQLINCQLQGTHVPQGGFQEPFVDFRKHAMCLSNTHNRRISFERQYICCMLQLEYVGPALLPYTAFKGFLT